MTAITNIISITIARYVTVWTKGGTWRKNKRRTMQHILQRPSLLSLSASSSRCKIKRGRTPPALNMTTINYTHDCYVPLPPCRRCRRSYGVVESIAAVMVSPSLWCRPFHGAVFVAVVKGAVYAAMVLSPPLGCRCLHRRGCLRCRWNHDFKARESSAVPDT